jgi:hypothetical protein
MINEEQGSPDELALASAFRFPVYFLAGSLLSELISGAGFDLQPVALIFVLNTN